MALSIGEAACTYAALILHDEGIPVTAEKIATLVKAANVNVESYWPILFAKLCEKRNIEDLIVNVGSGGGGTVAAVPTPSDGPAPAVAAPAVDDNKEEPPKDDLSDEDMIFGLFD